MRRLGSLRALARGYLDAEFGADGPRPTWLKGVFWVLLGEILLLGFTFVAMAGFVEGVRAADPHASGTYSWHLLPPLISIEDVTFEEGRARAFGFTFNVLVVLALPIAFALGARAWRWLPRWRRR